MSFAHKNFGFSELKEAWSIVRPWWFSEEKWQARFLFLSVFLIDMGIVGVGVWLTNWNKRFFNAFQDYALDSVWILLAEFLGIIFIGIISESSRVYLYQTLQMKWRKWVTHIYLKSWLNDSTFHEIEQLHSIDNADQRISEDLKNMVDLCLHLSLGFFSNLVTLTTYSIIIWRISGTLVFNISSWTIQIPGYMLWVSIIYAIVASIIMEKTGNKIVNVEYEQQLYESDFRFSMMRIRENSSQIAISNAGDVERKILKGLFSNIESNWNKFKYFTRKITIVEKGYTEFGVLLAYLVIIPRYFSRQITLGSIMQLTMSFTRIRVGFAWFVFQYKRLASLRSICRRLVELDHNFNIDKSHNIDFYHTKDGSLRVNDLALSLNDGRTIVNIPNLFVEKGSKWMIQGGSGKGKTSLLKAISGIWLYGKGSIGLPIGQMMFLPQEPYLPLANLATALCYPKSSELFSKEQCEEVMILCGLKHYANNLYDDDSTWSKKLSPGEKQRLAFARCILLKPDYLFMDESTSALDQEMEDKLFQLLLECLSNTTIVSVAHRRTLDKYHTCFYRFN